MSYADFLVSKRRVHAGDGFDQPVELSESLYEWQSAIVRWALKKGRAAVFADCGLGKTFMQVSWAQALRVPTLICPWRLCTAIG